MTLVSSIIQKAYRESNLIVIGATPTTAEASEGLDLLNSIVALTVGLEASDSLIDYNLGGEFDEYDEISAYVPINTRLLCNLSAEQTLLLDPRPRDGQRLAVVDVLGNLSTYNLTLDGNGRQIEGAATAVLNTDALNRQWMYRADLGEWVVVSPLTDSDEIPFPVEFDDYFIISLALRLNPRHSAALPGESLEVLRKTKKALQARYNVRREVSPDMTPLTVDNYNGYYDFHTGRRDGRL